MPFDPSVFLNQKVSGPLSTSVKACPEGEFMGIVSSDENWLTFHEIEMKKGDRAGQTTYQAIVLVEVVNEDVRQALGRQKVLVPYKMWLDTVYGTMILDKTEGKNVALGRLRKALDQNEVDDWSWGMLKGAGPINIWVKQRSDETNPEDKFAEIRKVAKPK